MRRHINTISLNENQAKKLATICQVIEFKEDHELIYEGHVPISAFLLLEGEVVLAKRRKSFQKLCPFHILGSKELMSNSPFKYSAIAKKGTRVIVLDRSTIHEILNDIEHLAYHAIKEHLASA